MKDLSQIRKDMELLMSTRDDLEPLLEMVPQLLESDDPEARQLLGKLQAALKVLIEESAVTLAMMDQTLIDRAHLIYQHIGTLAEGGDPKAIEAFAELQQSFWEAQEENGEDMDGLKQSAN